MKMIKSTLGFCALFCTAPAFAFLAGARPLFVRTPFRSTSTDTDDLLKPAYDIEVLPIRIGHGFDIHRMAPIQDAGQPLVIAGVEITHKDQKVSADRCIRTFLVDTHY